MILNIFGKMELFQVSPCRHAALEATIEGFERTGVPLVSYNSCNYSEQGFFELGPAGYSDDLGSYYFIPKLVELFGLNLETTIQLFYSGFVVLAFFAGAIGSWLYCETRLGKITSLIALVVLSLIIAGIGDTYSYMGAIPLAFIPWWLYLQKNGNPNRIIPFFVLAGFIFSFSHLTRSHAATPTLIFICLSLLFFSDHYSRKLKFISILGLTVAMSLVFIGFDTVLQQRIAFLTSIGTPLELSDQRYMWHVIYKSLGYLWNTFGYANWPGHEPSDTFVALRALEINPNILHASTEYENILRHETFKFIKQHPLFFLTTVFGKFGVVCMYILAFTNIGFVVAMYYSRGFAFNLLFAIGIGLNTIWAIAGIPAYHYLMGLFTFCTLFNVYSIDYAAKIRLSSHH